MGEHSTAALQIASDLLKIKAIKLSPDNPFTWASGWKSPIYCDNRLSLSYPEIRENIKNELAKVIKEKYPEAEGIAGVATAGIPQGALVADALGLPFLYVRSSPKGHGMENLIEGKLDQGQKVVVIEDLVSTGGSSLKAIESIRKSGGEVLGMLSIFTYSFSIAEENFKKADVELICLSNYHAMLEDALASGYIKNEHLEDLKAWRTDPASWKQ